MFMNGGAALGSNGSTSSKGFSSTTDFNSITQVAEALQTELGRMSGELQELSHKLFKTQEPTVQTDNSVNLKSHTPGSVPSPQGTSMDVDRSTANLSHQQNQNTAEKSSRPSDEAHSDGSKPSEPQAPSSHAFYDTTLFNNKKLQMQAGHFSRSNEDLQEALAADSPGKVHIEYVARGRRRPSMEKQLQFGISCQQSIQRPIGKGENEDAFRAIPFKIGGRRNSVISFSHLKADQEDESIPITKRRKLEEEIAKAKEERSSKDSLVSTPPPPSAASCSTAGANYAFFGVYDGHGGHQAADLARQQMHNKIVDHPNFKDDPETAIREAFRQVESQFIKDICSQNRAIHGVGTTAVVALVVTTDNATVLHVAHVGDSEAVLCRKGKPLVLTEPHNLKNPKERERVERCGGRMHKDRLGHPVWNPSYMNIAVTRAIGDYYFKCDEYTDGKQSGLIAEPQLTKIELTTDDEFLMLASDGFWDVVSKEKAIEFVKKYPKDYDVNLLCKELTDYALNEKTLDDTTVLLVKLQ